MKNFKNVSIVIPAYNEQNTIQSVLDTINDHIGSSIGELIVVNDCSVDNTKMILENLNIGNLVIINNLRNLGYGGSLKAGIKKAKKDFILMLDADGQHNVEHLKSLLDNDYEKYEAIIGSRSNANHSYIWRLPGKFIINRISSFIAGRKIPDLNSGLRIVKKSILLKYIHLCPEGFSFSSTITMSLVCRNYNVLFHPITVFKRNQGKSRVKIKDGFNTILLLLRLSVTFSPFKIFVPISITFFISGLMIGLPILFDGDGLSVGSLLLFISSMLSFSLGLLFDQISNIRIEKFE